MMPAFGGHAMAGILAGLMLGALTISVDQSGGLSPAQLEAVIEQMADIWRDAGVQVTMRRSTDDPSTTHAVISLRMVTFSLKPDGHDEPVLAWVGIGPDRVTLPLLFVSLPAITSAIAGGDYGGHPVRKLPPDVTQLLVARAVGRVAAHELGHYLLGHGGHRPRGLMRAAFSPDDLLGGWLGPFRVTEAERAAAAAEVFALARSQHGLQP
jgi:hypothetical protein